MEWLYIAGGVLTYIVVQVLFARYLWRAREAHDPVGAVFLAMAWPFLLPMFVLSWFVKLGGR